MITDPLHSADDGARDLLSDSLALARTQIADAVARNGHRFTAKQRALRAALIVLAIGLPAAALSIVLA